MPPKATPKPRTRRSTRAIVEDEETTHPAATPQADSANPLESQDAEMVDADQPAASLSVAKPKTSASASLSGELIAEPSSGAGPGERKALPLKFQPKGYTRRQKEQREAQERAEEERNQARLAVEEAGTGRGGARGGRAGFRGSLPGYPGGARATNQASGPLGGGNVFEGSGRGKGKPGRASGTPFTGSDIHGGPYTRKESGGDQASDQALGSTKKKPAKVKQEDGQSSAPAPASEMDDDGEARIDIERININLISDEEDENEQPTPQDMRADAKMDSKSPQPGGSSRAPGWVMHPIRLLRAEHVEREVGVNTDASSKTSAELRRLAKEKSGAEGGLFVEEDEPMTDANTMVPKKAKTRPRDVEVLGDKRVWQGVYREDEEVADETRVKTEPVDDDSAMAVDSNLPEGAPTSTIAADQELIDAASTAEPKKQLMNRKVSFSATDQVIEPEPIPTTQEPSRPPSAEPISTSSPRRSRKTPTSSKPVLQTNEEEEEWERYQKALQSMKKELLAVLGSAGSRAAAEDEEGDMAMTDAATSVVEGLEPATKAAEDNRWLSATQVFTFQLPPMIPKLKFPAPRKGKSKSKAKDSDAEGDSITEITPSSSSNPSKPPKTDAKSSKKPSGTPLSAYQVAFHPRAPSPPPSEQAHDANSLTLDPMLLSRCFETGFPIYDRASDDPSERRETVSADKKSGETIVKGGSAGKGEGKGKGKGKGGVVVLPPQGRVGTMVLFESGRVGLEWGGVGFEVKRWEVGSGVTAGVGVEVEGGEEKGMMAEGMGKGKEKETVEEEGEKEGGEDGWVKGSLWSVGQVKGGFIATPDWGDVH